MTAMRAFIAVVVVVIAGGIGLFFGLAQSSARPVVPVHFVEQYSQRLGSAGTIWVYCDQHTAHLIYLTSQAMTILPYGCKRQAPPSAEDPKQEVKP